MRRFPRHSDGICVQLRELQTDSGWSYSSWVLRRKFLVNNYRHVRVVVLPAKTFYRCQTNIAIAAIYRIGQQFNLEEIGTK